MAASLVIAGTEVAPITLYDVSVDTGRDDIESQPDASVLNATLSALAPAEVGQYVTLTDANGTLFHGWITDLTADLLEDMTWEVKVTATGPLAMLGHMRAGSVTYPQETDSARIFRTLEEAGAAHAVDPNIIGPALIVRPASVEPAEKIARTAADSGMGVLWEQPADTVAPLRYLPARFRRWAPYKLTWAELPQARWNQARAFTWEDFTSDSIGAAPAAPPELQLDPAEVFARATFKQQIGDYARTVTVTYGEPLEGATERPTVTVGTTDPVKDYQTELAVEADAITYANNMLRRTQQPGWRLDDVEIPLHILPPAESAAIRAALEVGTRITLPFPLGSPIGYVFQGFLEGWKHQLISETPEAPQHFLTLRISERSLTEAADRWLDIAPSITWEGTDPNMRWNDALVWRAA